MSKEINMQELDFLLRFNIDHNYVSPLDFLSNSAWSAIKVHTNIYLFLLAVFECQFGSLPFVSFLFAPGDEFHR